MAWRTDVPCNGAEDSGSVIDAAGEVFGRDFCARLCVRLSILRLNLCNLQILHHWKPSRTMAEGLPRLAGNQGKSCDRSSDVSSEESPFTHRRLKFFPLQSPFRDELRIKGLIRDFRWVITAAVFKANYTHNVLSGVLVLWLVNIGGVNVYGFPRGVGICGWDAVHLMCTHLQISNCSLKMKFREIVLHIVLKVTRVLEISFSSICTTVKRKVLAFFK